MTIDDLRTKLAAEQQNLIALEYRLEGMQGLYRAAVVTSDNQEADSVRMQIHELTDMRLDTLSSCALLVKAILDEAWRAH